MDLVIAGVNQLQSQITSRKTLKSMEQKYKDGWWPTRAPMGYINSGSPDDEKKRIITTDTFRAPLIAELFKMYATGDYSLIELRDLFYKKGLVTSVGKRVAMSKMFEMVKCHFYYGAMHWRGMTDIGKHEAIITKELFDKCQRVIKENNHYAYGVIDDAEFTKMKLRFREQIDGIEDEMHKLDQTKNLKMDVIQDVLALMRNIGKTYRKAPTELKRLYLGLFWDQFKSEDKIIVEATKSPIVLGLEQTNSLIWKEGNITTNISVIISPEGGAYPDSNRR